MRTLYSQLRSSDSNIVAAYAKAEQKGTVARRSNARHLSPEQYAQALLLDGLRKGWIHGLKQ